MITLYCQTYRQLTLKNLKSFKVFSTSQLSLHILLDMILLKDTSNPAYVPCLHGTIIK